MIRSNRHGIHIRSLVDNTGLLVCLSICLMCIYLTGCGNKPVMYELDMDETDIQVTYTDEKAPDECEGAGAGDADAAILDTADVVQEQKVLIVHLCGAVNNPGVYELAIDSRIIDGINEAGGFAENASEDALNLAMEVTDGSRIYVPTIDEVEAETDNAGVYGADRYVTQGMGSSGTETAVLGDKKVNINTADISELMTLSGIGESRAKSIVAYRQEHGGFKSIEEIKNISGIGDASFEKLKGDITI